MNWFGVFLYLWAAGISGALGLIPAPEVGRRFFRFHVAILLVLATVATVVAQPLLRSVDSVSQAGYGRLADIVALVLVVDIVAISTLVFGRSRPIVPMAFLLPVVTGAIFATLVALAVSPDRPAHAALLTVHLVTSGALLGSVVVAMNLGHAYLQNAALSFDHLVRTARFLLGAAIAKSIVSLVLLAPQAGAWWPKLLDDFDGMLILVRVVAGLAGPVVLGGMVLSCARSRANQSATGILYAAVVFVLVGEAISMYLTLGRGIRA